MPSSREWTPSIHIGYESHALRCNLLPFPFCIFICSHASQSILNTLYSLRTGQKQELVSRVTGELEGHAMLRAKGNLA